MQLFIHIYFLLGRQSCSCHVLQLKDWDCVGKCPNSCLRLTKHRALSTSRSNRWGPFQRTSCGSRYRTHVLVLSTVKDFLSCCPERLGLILRQCHPYPCIYLFSLMDIFMPQALSPTAPWSVPFHLRPRFWNVGHGHRLLYIQITSPFRPQCFLTHPFIPACHDYIFPFVGPRRIVTWNCPTVQDPLPDWPTWPDTLPRGRFETGVQ